MVRELVETEGLQIPLAKASLGVRIPPIAQSKSQESAVVKPL